LLLTAKIFFAAINRYAMMRVSVSRPVIRCISISAVVFAGRSCFNLPRILRATERQAPCRLNDSHPEDWTLDKTSPPLIPVKPARVARIKFLLIVGISFSLASAFLSLTRSESMVRKTQQVFGQGAFS
jgi:hypothetical protein